MSRYICISLQWRHNGRDGVSNHQPHHCLLNRYSTVFSSADQRKHQSSGHCPLMTSSCCDFIIYSFPHVLLFSIVLYSTALHRSPYCHYVANMTIMADVKVTTDFKLTKGAHNSLCVRHFTSRYYRKTSNISRTLVGNKIVDNSDVVGASPVGAAPTTSSFST